MLFEKLAGLIAEQFGVDESTLTTKTNFVENLGADSLDLVELSMMLEEEFDLGEIEDSVLEGLTTIGDVVELITARSPE
ncbi:MAG: acyl carrier protein [Oscillospiraceae bacterium]|jgi:acyl carrier protein|nr:acyl carrier protein [Oscillospiraceae bacterium]